MAGRHAVLVGHDAAPTAAFGMVKQELLKRGWTVESFVGGKENTINTASSGDLVSAISMADVILVGMSVPTVENPGAAKMEKRAALLARDYGKPYGFYADTFGACAREWFKDYSNDASFVFVLNNTEKLRAFAFYPRAKIVIVGNHEWGAARFPGVSRDDVRRKLSIGNDEFLIFAPGHKESTISSYLLMSLAHAVHLVPCRDMKFQVVFMPHPLDGVPADVCYAAPIVFSHKPIRMIAKGMLYSQGGEEGKMPQLISEKIEGVDYNGLTVAMDVLVESCSTSCQTAALRRNPIVTVITELQQNRNDFIFAQHRWEPVLQGIALEAYGDANDLAAKLAEAVNPKSALRRALLKRQKELFPGFAKKDEFECRIANTLEEVVNKK